MGLRHMGPIHCVPTNWAVGAWCHMDCISLKALEVWLSWLVLGTEMSEYLCKMYSPSMLYCENKQILSAALLFYLKSHAGKVVLRSWYEKNKHIFPASRWEPYDPEKKWDKYTVRVISAKQKLISWLFPQFHFKLESHWLCVASPPTLQAKLWSWPSFSQVHH